MRFLFFLVLPTVLFGKVSLGVDRFFDEGLYHNLKGKNIALVVNHTSANGEMESTVDLFAAHRDEYTLKALFTPEHGFDGSHPAGKKVSGENLYLNIPVRSLYGETFRPTKKMLEGIDVIIYDIQDIGVRTYTYATTLFYVMEAAAKENIEVIVLDRPNPIGGINVEGPLVHKEWRSIIGYLDVPLRHGMTIGELATFFNREKNIDCKLSVIPMKGWERSMSFEDTNLSWMPTSPQIPEPSTPLYNLTTGVIGELGIVNIGIGYTTPFKTIAAPFIDAKELAAKLNEQKLPGVRFIPFHYRPWFGLFKNQHCHGVLISISDRQAFQPVATQYFILGILKLLYPTQINDAVTTLPKQKKDLFCKAIGNSEVFEIILNEKYIAWKLVDMQKKESEPFFKIREKYLLY